jgi:plasmid stabilization system protein ParE
VVQNVTWLPLAQSTFSDALQYLNENFSEREIQKFTEKIQQTLLVIKANPRLGRSCKKANIFRIVINKRILLFYRYRPMKKEIQLLLFWNMWQDPKKLNW